MNMDPSGYDWQSFLTFLERFFTGVSDLCAYIIKYPEKNRVSWKAFHKVNPNVSERAFYRGNFYAFQETSKLCKTLNKVATVLSVATLALDIGSSWYSNYSSGKSTWVSDSVVDTVYTVLRFAVSYGITSVTTALIPVPFLGTAIGIGISIGIDYLIQWAIESTGILDQIKSWAAGVGQSIANGWNYFWSFAWI